MRVVVLALIGIAVAGVFIVTRRTRDATYRGSNQRTPNRVAQSTKVIRPASVSDVVAKERQILSLTPMLNRVALAVENLCLPDHRVRDLFSNDIQLVDVIGVKQGENTHTLLSETEWTIGASAHQPMDGLTIWNPLFEQIRYFDNADLKIVEGSFIDNHRRMFETHVAFEAQALLYTGKPSGIYGNVTIRWSLAHDNQWVIDQWVTRDLHMLESDTPLFEETLDALVADEESRGRARRSEHEEMIVQLLRTGRFTLPKKDYYPYFTTDSNNQHPGISVVDIEGDGDDDLYVTARWGRNQLWVNQGDGAFTEDAKSYRLDVDGLCNCALFADFDNDGDQDVFLGRSLERSLLLFNYEGEFRRQPERVVNSALPFLVSTVSACDYNKDGLLDLFLGTYGPTLTDGAGSDWGNKFLTRQQQREYQRREKGSHRYFDLVGPPNQLLINRGNGQFERAPESPQLEDYRNTYQGTWADYDNDGDSDLYVCNDFAPDALYRNDGPDDEGRIQFTDVSVALAGDAMKGFGMGASWGDYDGDGFQDLYVSNMFSKAGRRITKQVGDVDSRITYSAQGNLLLRNNGLGFDQVAGLYPPAMTVAKVGWSFGGQFADVDNDGWLDLYVPSGFYSAPPEASTDVDL